MTRRYGRFFGFIADRFRFAYRSEAAYRTLGVSETASDAEIEQAYLRLIAQYRPDRLVGVAEPLRRQAEKKASEVEAAHDRIRALRRRPAQREPAPAPAPSAPAGSEPRGTSGGLLWVALALIALVAINGIDPLRDLWMPAPPQARMPAPEVSAERMPATAMPASDMPPPPAVAASPAPSPAPAAVAPAPAEDAASVDRMVVLMPKDPPPAPRPPPPPALSGEAALVEALRTGQLRPATGGDLSRWAARWSGANGRSVPSGFRERSGFMTSYVIQKDFTIPEGLTGAHAVIFLLDTRVPYPRGDPGHSVVLDLSTGACMGATCGMLLD